MPKHKHFQLHWSDFGKLLLLVPGYIACYAVYAFLSFLTHHIYKFPHFVTDVLYNPIHNNWLYIPFVFLFTTSIFYLAFKYILWPRITLFQFLSSWCWIQVLIIGSILGSVWWFCALNYWFQPAVFNFCGDWLLISILLGWIFFFVERRIQPKALPNPPADPLILDPIKSVADDKLDYASVVRELTNEIKAQKKAIALIGHPGIGKTSIINMVKENLLSIKQPRYKYIFLDFPALNYKTENDMVKGFYQNVINRIQEESFSPKLITISSRFLNLFSSATFNLGFIHFPLDFCSLTKKDNFNNLSKIIQQHLEQHSLNLVVFADDLERCSKNKLYIFIQMMHTICTKNIIIVVSGSREILAYPADVQLRSIVE